MDKSELRELSFTCCILCGPTIGQEIIENRSVRFYERNGYQQVGKITNLYRPGITEYMMAKDLNKK